LIDRIDRAGAPTLLLGALIAAAPFAMDIYPRPMALTIAVTSLGAFASLRIAHRPRTPLSR
jgi:hypothetical protein